MPTLQHQKAARSWKGNTQLCETLKELEYSSKTGRPTLRFVTPARGYFDSNGKDNVHLAAIESNIDKYYTRGNTNRIRSSELIKWKDETNLFKTMADLYKQKVPAAEKEYTSRVKELNIHTNGYPRLR